MSGGVVNENFAWEGELENVQSLNQTESYIIFFVQCFSQLKMREMLSTLHFMNLPAKASGNMIKGMTKPIASKMALLWGYLQISS